MESIDSYLTIELPAEALLKEKGSKFFAYAMPAESVEQAMQNLDEVKKDHHSARHWCYAYRIGVTGESFRSNDDGEPSHSAGDPILRQIDSKGLTNIIVVVVRYFGGVKLGVGGLIQAYGGAAAIALDDASVITRIIYEAVKVDFGYEDMSEVMRLIKKFDAQMIEHSFENTCTLKAKVSRDKMDEFLEELTLLHRVSSKHLGMI